MTTRRSITRLAALVTASLLAVSCGSDDPGAGDDSGDGTTADETAADDDDPIRIGISLPLTGDFAEPGKGVQQGYEMWAKNVNDSGGLLGRQVELIFRDDASDPNKVVSDYEQLINVEEVDFVFGPFSSRLVIPASQVAEDEKMLFLEPAGAAADVFNRGLEYLFYPAPAVASDHYNFLAEYILALPDDERPTTVGVASLDDPFAMDTAYGLRDALAAGGIDVVIDEVYPPGTTDYSTLAAKIADAEPEIFIGGTQFEDSVGMLRAFEELGYRPPFIAFTTGPNLPDQFTEAVGDARNGVLSPVAWSVTAGYPSNVEFVEAFQAEFGVEPNEDAANGYTVGQVFAQALLEVGCADSSEECQTAMRDYIRTATFDTVEGPIAFDEDGRPTGAYMIQQWIDGNPEIVLPADSDVQTADLIRRD